MFTGIVRSLGTIVELAPHHLVVDAPGVDEQLGASIAVDGCCLTVVEVAEVVTSTAASQGDEVPVIRRYRFDILPETLDRTRLRSLATGARVNVEPALRAGEPLGGHLVQGHVDGVGTVRRSGFAADERSLDLEIDVASSLLGFCIDRGSITVNGTSLTVMRLDDAGLALQLVPETQARTNLGLLAPGDLVNIEADVIARYVARLMPPGR